MRRIGWVILFLGIVGLWWLWRDVQTRALPGTTFANQDLSRATRAKVLASLSQAQAAPVRLRVKNRDYVFTHQELGVEFDLNQTLRRILPEKGWSWQQLWYAYVLRRQRTQAARAVLRFLPRYFERLSAQEFDFSTRPDEVVVDQSRQRLAVNNYQEKYLISAQRLQPILAAHWGEGRPIIAPVERVLDGSTESKVAQVNARLNQVFAEPLTLMTQESSRSWSLSPQLLRELAYVEYQGDQVRLRVWGDKLLAALVEWEKGAGLNQDYQVERSSLLAQLQSALNERYRGERVGTIAGVMTAAANTRGERYPKYIEIDLSQQRMYLWENGQEVGTHRISSGLYFPTPPGEYKILNKADNAYSYLYHVWMPYWMAFSLDPTVNAYLGIHELPYWVDGSGTEQRRPRDFIGSPHTGGCVSLDVGEAKQVYDWAQVGTPVLIFE